MPAQVLLLDPYHVYATRFIDTIYRRFGLTTVCAHTDPVQMRRQSWRFPILNSAAVDAHYAVGAYELEPFAHFLLQEHDIAAVIPHLEAVVAPSAHLAHLLHLTWAQPDVHPLFRNKLAMKAHLRSHPDAPRINAFTGIRTEHDVMNAIATGQFDRFVLKPLDAYGGNNVEFFAAHEAPARLHHHLAKMAGSALIMEEYLHGPEFFVNGQVDGDGTVTVTRVGRYHKPAANGRVSVKHGSRTVHTYEPEFTPLATYAEQVIRCTGLRRSPFHLEAKIDEHGPCLIEVGARLAGTDEALTDDLAHGVLNTTELAARHYLTEGDTHPVPLDWSAYDRRAVGHVSGVSNSAGRMYALGGASEVEHLPGFHWWVAAPRVGQRLHVTVDLLTQPYEAVLEADNVSDLQCLIETVRSIIHWNDTPPGVATTVRKTASLIPVARRQLKQRALRTSLRPWHDAGQLSEPGAVKFVSTEGLSALHEPIR